MKSHSKRKRVFLPPTFDFPFPTSTLASDFRRHAFASESCILMRQLDIAVRHHEFISFSVFSFFFFSKTCPSTKKLEIYACDWITTLSERQLHSRQTLKNRAAILPLHLYWPLTRKVRKRARGVCLREIILLGWGEWQWYLLIMMMMMMMMMIFIEMTEYNY